MKSNKNNFFSWNCIYGSFKLFSGSKIDCWLLLKLQKIEFGLKKIRENLISRVFLAWTFKIFWLSVLRAIMYSILSRDRKKSLKKVTFFVKLKWALSKSKMTNVIVVTHTVFDGFAIYQDLPFWASERH